MNLFFASLSLLIVFGLSANAPPETIQDRDVFINTAFMATWKSLVILLKGHEE